MKQSKPFKPVSIIILFLCVCLYACKGQSYAQNQPLQLLAAIPLPRVSGRIDHMAFDDKQQLLFIAALGNNTVEVVDLKAKKIIHSIKGVSEPQGIAYIPQSNSIAVASGGNGECAIFNAASFQKIAAIQLGGDADNIRYDSTKKIIYVGYGNGAIAGIDATTFKQIEDIKLAGHPESFQLDNTLGKIFVNVPTAQMIEVIDLQKKMAVDKWPLQEAKANFPMSLDKTGHRLFVGCRHPAKLLVIDTQTGKTITALNTGSDADDVFYNNLSKQIYLSCGSGFINVFKQADINHYTMVAKISTHAGARTSLWLPRLNQLVVASPSRFNGNAQLFIYQKIKNNG